MKRATGMILVLIGVLTVIRAVLPLHYSSLFDVSEFARLPTLSGGRLKPLDSAARAHLLAFHGKQTFFDNAGEKRSAVEWLMDTVMDPAAADGHAVFRIDHADWLGLFESEQDAKVYFSFNDLRPHLAEIERQSQLVTEETQKRTPYERAVIKLHTSLVQYFRLKPTIVPEESVAASVEAEIREYEGSLQSGTETEERGETGERADKSDLNRFPILSRRYQFASDVTLLNLIPPTLSSAGPEGWRTVGGSLLDSARTLAVDPIVFAYARLSDAYTAGEADRFNRILDRLRAEVTERYPSGARRHASEYHFNSIEPFYVSSIVYVLVFLVACISWLIWPEILIGAAFRLLLLAFSVHTLGLVARIVIQGRPPVTNLYSSAVFVGFIAVLLSVILERLFRNGVASAVAGIAGFTSLVIAHNLSGSGDTMEMMRAVLDSNFWLSTHVVSITIGYSATFLAGLLAIIFIIRGVCTNRLDDATARILPRMVYGIVAFALLFSFVGTVLGGIWADQSWGRFWGWDPKENGALMIVIWNAIVLHARWGRMVERRGLMVVTVFGNVITAWSWFGTNMLGIGLHAYGFMDKAFLWLMIFIASQIVIMLAGMLPANYWRSPNALGRL